MTDKDQTLIILATTAMEGMLSHSTRYKPREQDSDKHWHQALASEAFDIAESMYNEFEERRIIPFNDM